MSNELKPNCEWKDDCCGKKDYDGQIISISTRYWPRGGGAIIVDSRVGVLPADATIRPSATSSLILDFKGTNDEDYIKIATADFEGETFEEIAAQVEKWTQEQFDKMRAALTVAFPRISGDSEDGAIYGKRGGDRGVRIDHAGCNV